VRKSSSPADNGPALNLIATFPSPSSPPIRERRSAILSDRKEGSASKLHAGMNRSIAWQFPRHTGLRLHPHRSLRDLSESLPRVFPTKAPIRPVSPSKGLARKPWSFLLFGRDGVIGGPGRNALFPRLATGACPPPPQLFASLTVSSFSKVFPLPLKTPRPSNHSFPSLDLTATPLHESASHPLLFAASRRICPQGTF